MDTFRKNWQDARREVINRSAREIQCAHRWAQIENPKVTFDQLETPGRVLEQWDAKILVEALNAAEGIPDLFRELRREEDRIHKLGPGCELSGRQAYGSSSSGSGPATPNVTSST